MTGTSFNPDQADLASTFDAIAMTQRGHAAERRPQVS
jgi:hypothetical protein